MALTTNLQFDLGESWQIDGTCNDTDGVTPLGLTGATISFYVRRRGDSQLLISPSQVTTSITSAAAGKYRIRMSPAQQQAAGLTPQAAWYLIRITLNDGTVTDQNDGAFIIRPTAAG